MLYSLKGVVSHLQSDSLVLNVHDVGFQIFVTHTDSFKVGETLFLYTCFIFREDKQFIIGFPSLEEKEVFNLLIKVKGLGPKSVFNALKTSTPKQIKDAIAVKNIAYLKKLPGIGAKVASQIILDLKGELTASHENSTVYSDVYEALKTMGFKPSAIEKALASLNDPELKEEEVLKRALKKLSGYKK